MEFILKKSGKVIITSHKGIVDIKTLFKKNKYYIIKEYDTIKEEELK